MQRIIILILLMLFIAGNHSLQAGTLPELGLVYTGEVKLTYLTEEGECSWTPGYLFYLQGEPAPNSYLLLYLQPQGQLIDQIFLSYQHGPWEMELGDMTFQQLGGDFFSYDQNQRGGLLGTHFLDQSLSVELLGAKVQGINMQEEIEGTGSVGPYFLSHSAIIPDSVKVKRQGKWLGASDYQVILPEGPFQLPQLIFTQPLEEGEKVAVNYAYQPGGGMAERLMGGINLTADWATWQAELNWVKIADQPGEDSLFARTTKTFEGRVAEIRWQPWPWLRSETQLAWANYTGKLTYPDSGFVQNTSYQDYANSVVATLGDSQNYLRGGYLYQGPEFVSGIDEIDPFAFMEKSTGLTEKSLEGRWQVTPELYLLLTAQHQEDLLDPNSFQPATYERSELVKGLWQVSDTASWQLTLQQKDTGDDLIYIPTGSILQTGALTYQQQADEWENQLEVQVGQERIKNQNEAARDSYRFVSLYTRTGWQKEGWQAGYSLDTTYYDLLDSSGTDTTRGEYFFKYDLTYPLQVGKLVYHGEEDLYRDAEITTRHHLYELGYQYRWQKYWQGTVKYQRDIRNSVQSTTTKDKLILHLVQHQPVRIDTRWTWQKQYLFGQTRLAGDNWESQWVWLTTPEMGKVTGSYQVTLRSDLKLETLLTYQQKPLQKLKTWVLTLKGQYQIRPGLELNLSGDLPLPMGSQPAEANQDYSGRVEIIYTI